MSAVWRRQAVGGAGGRSYGRITPGDLSRLAEVARVDREDFFARKPRYRVLEEGLVCAALLQTVSLSPVGTANP